MSINSEYLFRRISAIILFLPLLVFAQEADNLTYIRSLDYAWYGNVTGVAVSGNIAYCATNESGLRLLNISNPANPVEIPSDLSNQPCRNLALTENYLFLNSGTQFFKIPRSLSTEFVGISPVASRLERMIPYQDGEIVYLCCGTEGFQVAQYIQSLNTYRIVYFDTTIHEAINGMIVGNRLYIAGGADFVVFDISQPAAPRRIGRHELFYFCCDVAVSGDYAYVADMVGGLVTLNIARLDSIYQVAQMSFTEAVYQVKIRGNLLFAQYDYFECPLAILDISQPASPQLLSVYRPPQYIPDFDIVGNRVYIADIEYGLRIVDVSQPSHPTEIGSYNRCGIIQGVRMSGSTAAINQNCSIRLFDLSNINEPVMGGLYEASPVIYNYRIIGNSMYVLSNFGTRISVVNIADFRHPVEVGNLQSTTENEFHYNDIVTLGSYCYASTSNGFDVLDFTHPDAPTRVLHYFDTTCTGSKFQLDGATLYLDQSGVHKSFDVSDPAHPEFLEQFQLSDYPNASTLAVRNNVMYFFCDYPATLYAMDIRNVNRPVILDSLIFGSTMSEVSDARIDPTGNQLFLALGRDGVLSINISNPSRLRVHSAFYSADQSLGLDLQNNHVIVADRSILTFLNSTNLSEVGEMQIQSLPNQIEMTAAYPNPFNATTTIRYSLPVATDVAMSVFDVSGRKVQSLVNSQQTAGLHTVQFNRAALGSGTYFVNLTAGNYHSTQRVVLLK